MTIQLGSKGETINGIPHAPYSIVVGLSRIAEMRLAQGGDATILAAASSQPSAVAAAINAIAGTGIGYGSFFAPGVALVPAGSSAPALSISGVPPVSGTVGQLYNFVPVIVGGQAPYTVTRTAGTLPAGTALNASTGVVTGTLTGSAAGYAGINLHVVDALGAAADLALPTITISAASGGGVAPGTVTGLTAGTATSSTQPLSWTAPSTGDAPITYAVGYRLTSAGGAFTTANGSVSGTSFTVTGLAANTAYDYQVTPSNSVGVGTAQVITNKSTAAAAASLKPGYFNAPATALTSGTQALITGRQELAGSTNGGKAGNAPAVQNSGNDFAWFVFANAASVTFHDDTNGFNGGFAFQGTFVDANSVTWYAWKSSFAGSYTSPISITTS